MRLLHSEAEVKKMTAKTGLSIPLPLEVLRVRNKVFCPHCGLHIYPSTLNNKCPRCKESFYI